MEKVQLAARVIAAIVGMALIVIGVRYAMLLFGQIYEGVINPASVSDTLDGWARYIVRDLDGMEHNAALGKVEHLRIIALFIVAIGGLMLTWLTIHLVVAGARVVQIATTWQAIKGAGRDEDADESPRRSPPKVRQEPAYAPIPPRQGQPAKPAQRPNPTSRPTQA